MSQHPSLLGSGKGKQHRSVLKRYEKLKYLIEKEKWGKEADSVYNLPKIKIVRFKAKKEKAAATEAEATAAPGAAPAAAPGAKPQQATAKTQQTAAKPTTGKAAADQAPQKEKKPKA